VEAPYPWTDVTNMLILDIPLGSGWSYANSEDGVSNSSAWTAGEVDDVLQVRPPSIVTVVIGVADGIAVLDPFPSFYPVSPLVASRSQGS
jgi:hypothetical protein